ncbi:uncharacterized protein LOC129898594 [Solanum dulcamara]|uniref:uncharacterized protein LOC129898594 n=1 Tax=Solanum dulcamara TaxID=45834 RepID=UPI00248504D1|nr:uncharacterized protein LOC129898594 [Solanum dulcamara]
MEASKKLVAVFLVCIIVISSSVQVSMANEEKFEAASTDYIGCYNECQKECSGGYTHCEMKCDEDCTAKLLKDRIQKLKN